ncbi:hypothetical protein [uncultured Nostoc sp.]|uniref:hypothetical protein n=1 Tax=uncultured Nostoc sp. TaxID=340711 RepID=UPI0035C96D7D
MLKNSGLFSFGMINKNNSVECHASYHEGLLKFFAAFRMTTQHQTTYTANQFFAGDASALPSGDAATSMGFYHNNCSRCI